MGRTRSRAPGIACLLVAGVFALAGCGAAAPSPSPTPQPTPDLTAFNACSKLWADTFSAFDDLDGRLSVGILYADYTTRVGDIAAAFTNASPEGNLDIGCATVGVKAYIALQAYSDAGTLWSRHIRYPNVGPKISEVQAKWKEAGEAVAETKAALEQMKIDAIRSAAPEEPAPSPSAPANEG